MRAYYCTETRQNKQTNRKANERNRFSCLHRNLSRILVVEKSFSHWHIFLVAINQVTAKCMARSCYYIIIIVQLKSSAWYLFLKNLFLCVFGVEKRDLNSFKMKKVSQTKHKNERFFIKSNTELRNSFENITTTQSYVNVILSQIMCNKQLATICMI